MSRFKQGQVITLKSDKGITGAIVNIIEGYPETRYQVFTATGMQTYYESQIDIQKSDEEMEKVDAERFNAGLTASLIRNPSISSLYSLNTAKIDFIPHQFRPVLKFIRADRPRLLIADGVGVGKTIEAGLILRELQARRNLDSVLIICPRPLVSERKWEEEMKQISDANRIKYGTEAEKILRIIINQYSDRTHFIYEILQNAEDAGATRIQFHLEKEKLVIEHNGRPFNEKDIEGVCGIANGTKEDGTRIGHFGIGFKSVYCYTEHPYIYSGEYHFVIQNQLFPAEVSGRKEIAYDETCMILPFDKNEVPSGVAYQEIRDALTKKITAESIIMLDRISDVKIKIDGYPEEIEINKAKYSLDKKTYANNVFGLSMNTTIMNTSTKQTRTRDADYLFFTDANREATAIIFRVEGKELKAIKNSKIYAFFPTAKEAHQNFYIHAPFDTTPARDNFKEGAEYGKHNIELVKAIGELIWFAFQWMKNHRYLSVSGFNTVFPVYEYENDDVLYGIYQNSIDMIREEALLPTNVPGEFKKIQEICVPLWGIIVDIFDDNDLRTLRKNRNISWLAKEFSTEAYRDVRAFLNQNFKLETLEWKDLVLNMDAFFLSQKQLSWMEALLSRIESYCIKRTTYDSHYIDVSQIPFVRTVSQEQICARDGHGKLQVYLNNPDIAKYRIESTFIKNETIRSFYRRALEIPEYNIEQETIENILPKYEYQSLIRTDYCCG